MAIEDDVLVIGGGLAGIAAAVGAHEQGARVRLVSHKQSTMRQASGLIDLLGYTPDGDGPVVNPFEAIEELPEGHPYERAGLDAVRAGMDMFDDAAGEMYAGSHTDKNALVPTHGGATKPTARYPDSAAPGIASADGDTLFVGFDSMIEFDAPVAADHLAATGVPYETDGVTIEFPGNLRDDAKVTRFAHLLDHDDEVAVDGTTMPVRTALAERVKEHVEGHKRIGFPAVLGDDHPAEIRAELADRLGASVFEVPMGPPSLPGLRLEDRLYEYLHEIGVRVSTGNPIVDVEQANGEVDRVVGDHTGREVPYKAQQYILATGGLVGKGIDSDREGVYEPVFDCHVPHPADRYDWFEDGAFDDHEFARFGVPVDTELRPLDADDAPEYENLRAAGSVLGGYDFPSEKSGSGVSLATGYAAGQRAGERV